MTRLGIYACLGRNVARIWGVLVAEGIMPPVTTTYRGVAYYAFIPNQTLDSLYDAWDRDLAEPRTDEEFKRAKLVYSYLPSDKDRLPPWSVIRAVARSEGWRRRYTSFQLAGRIAVRHEKRQAVDDALQAAALAIAAEEDRPLVMADPIRRPSRSGRRAAPREWTYNIAQDDPQGRVLLPVHLIHPEDTPERRENGTVDLTPLSGTPIRIRRTAVCQLIGCDLSLRTLVKAGLIPERDGWYSIDPAATRQKLRETFVAGLEAPTTVAEFRFARQVDVACALPSSELPPPVVIRAAARRLGPKISSPGEVAAILPSQGKRRERLLDALRSAKGVEAVRERLAWGQDVSEEELAERFAFLKGASRTCFDPELGEEYRSPDATSRARLARLGPMADAAAVFAYRHAPLFRCPAMLPGYLRSVRRFEREATADNPAFDPADRAMLDRALDHVAFGPVLTTALTPAVRDQVVRETLSVLRRARRACQELDPDGTRAVLAHAPAEPSDPKALLERLQERYGEHRAAHKARRKRFSNVVANRFERVVDSAAFRIAQLRADGDAMRAAMDTLNRPENAELAYWDFEAEGSNLSERGLPIPGWQRREYRLWRVEAAERLTAVDSPPELDPAPEAFMTAFAVASPQDAVDEASDAASASARARRRPLNGSQYIVEHLRTVGVRGGQAIDPFYVTLARHHALSPGGLLDVGQTSLRDELARRWRLPKYRATARGLVSFEKRRARIARHTSRSSRTFKRCFVPLEGFEYAVRLAGHGLDCVVQTWCRQGEFMQQTEYQEDWAKPKGSKRYAWRYTPKLGRHHPIPHPLPFLEVDDDCYAEARRLIAVNVRRCHPEGHLPDIRPNSRLAWKCSAQPYLFSCDGFMIDPPALNHFLLLLLANVAVLRFHDCRHAGSNRARVENTPLEVIMVGLRHRSRTLSDYYSELTPAQVKAAERRAAREKLLRIAKHEERRRAA